MERGKLHRNIAERAKGMFERGWVEEVERLLGEGSRSRVAGNANAGIPAGRRARQGRGAPRRYGGEGLRAHAAIRETPGDVVQERGGAAPARGRRKRTRRAGRGARRAAPEGINTLTSLMQPDSLRGASSGVHAGIAQLVEYQLPKLRVAGSNPVARSILYRNPLRAGCLKGVFHERR